MATTSIGRRALALALTAAAALVGATAARTQLQVVATVPDLADIAEQIGGDHVVAKSLMAGHEDLHMVRIRPSMVVKVRRADVFLQLGLDAEHAWVPPLLRTSRNREVNIGAPGFCNAAKGVKALQVPVRMTRDQGPDLHPTGNPHYNLDPVRMRLAARNVRDCFVRVDPEHKAAYDAGLKRWESKLDENLTRWRAQLEPFAGSSFVESHNSWVYFAETFDLNITGQLEPKPGLSPTPAHLAKMIRLGKDEDVGLVICQWQFEDVARRVAGDIGGAAVTLPLCSSSKGPLHGWFRYMDHVVAEFAAHLRRPKAAAAAAAASASGDK